MFKLALSLSQLGCPVQNDDNARMSNYLFFEDIFKRYFESRRRNRILNVSYRIKILLSHIRLVDQAQAFTIFFGNEKQT